MCCGRFHFWVFTVVSWPIRLPALLVWWPRNLVWVHSPSSLHVWPSGTLVSLELFLQCNIRFTKLEEHSDLVPPHHVIPNQLPTSLSACASPWVAAELSMAGRVCGYMGQGTPGELLGDIPKAPWKLLIESYSLLPGRLRGAQHRDNELEASEVAALIASILHLLKTLESWGQAALPKGDLPALF